MTRLVATALGILLFGTALGFVLTSALRPRAGEDDVITGGVVAPGGQVVLNPAAPSAPSPVPPAEPQPQAPTPDPAAEAELERLARRARAAPADVEAQLALVRAAVDADRGDLALPALDRVLARQPKHPGALTYLGLMTAAQGRYDHGLELIDQALAAAPGDTFALWAKGGLLFQHRRDYAAAAAAWEAMLRSPKVDAATRRTVQEWVAEARWRAERGDEVGRTAGRGAAPASRPFVSGTVSLGAGVDGGPAQTGALFVIARRAGATGGPPLAVKRIEAPRFPVAYALGAEDMMLPGRPLEGDLEIIARLSRSGAAGPAKPGDLEGRSGRNPVRPGASGVDVALTPFAAPSAAPAGGGAR